MSLENHLQALRRDTQVTFDTQAKVTQGHLLKHTQVTLDTGAKAAQDRVVAQLHTSQTLVDGTTSADHKYRSDEAGDTERRRRASTRAVATGFTQDTSEEKIQKFLKDTILNETLNGQMTQINCTRDPTTRAFFSFRTKAERNNHVGALPRG